MLPEDLRRLFKNYIVALNFEAAEASLEPFDESRSRFAACMAAGRLTTQIPTSR